MDDPSDLVLELANSEQVDTPDVIPSGKETVAFTAVGAALGASVAGTPGALVGGTVGWAMDTIRRRLMRRPAA